MASAEKLSISLPAELAASVHRAVDSGKYASTSEVIREALRGWQQVQELEQAELDYLRAAWKEGMESGVSEGSFDVRGIGQKAREILARERAGDE